MARALELSPFLADRRREASDALVRLAAHATLVRALRAGTCIAVQSGRIWLTQTGDANDYFVDAGQRHVLARGGRVVIESFTPQATLRLLRDAPAARPGFP
jgi:ferric-dicitrate binding protein FerR (iron transport regulator)